MTDAVTIRPEQPSDVDAIHRIIAAAFPADDEARLVARLRNAGALTLSLVAVSPAGEIVGHVAFSPVTIEGQPVRALGLAPVAVAPDRQRQGIGSDLVRAGISTCRDLGYSFVVVLGHPEYYQRFGFSTGSAFGLENEYGVDEPFMALPLHLQGLDGIRGLVRYHATFAELS